MTWRQEYACGTCEDQRLVITVERRDTFSVFAAEYVSWQWVVSCGNGHRLTPVPDTVLTLGPQS